jgi:hypothetical protein
VQGAGITFTLGLDIGDDELRALKRLAETLMLMNHAALDQAVSAGQLVEIRDG